MRTIDGVKYIDTAEYCEMVNVQRSTVTNMKREGRLPFVSFPDLAGIELINYDKLEMTESEKAWTQMKISSTENLYQYSAKDLGNFLSKYILNLIQLNSNADFKHLQDENKLTEMLKNIEKIQQESRLLNEKLSLTENQSFVLKDEFDKANESLLVLINENKEVANQLDELTGKYDTLVGELKEKEDSLRELSTEFKTITVAYDALSLLNNDLVTEKNILHKNYDETVLQFNVLQENALSGQNKLLIQQTSIVALESKVNNVESKNQELIVENARLKGKIEAQENYRTAEFDSLKKLIASIEKKP